MICLGLRKVLLINTKLISILHYLAFPEEFNDGYARGSSNDNWEKREWVYEEVIANNRPRR